ncbi:MAG TPA: hypothetical protein VMG12_19985 [Polyangiaceae bacterium]|nr:hypothetical protein [Polyangiaceae bacterium]
MKTFVWTAVGVMGLSALGVACAGADYDSESFESVDDVIGTSQQPLCENKGGTNAVMTALAVAAGKELGRWLPERDFQWNSSTGMLELSVNAAPRCRTQSPNGLCSNLQALLDMQKPAAHGKVTFPGNITLDSNLLKSQLKANWSAQSSCNSSGACTVQNHDLKYTHVESGSCDKKFYFDPKLMGTSTRMSATEADKLKNKLKFLGYPSNKMLNFYMRDGQVSVDPTYGLNEGTTTTVGSCDAACTKFSSSDVSGRCCNCNGASRTYKRSTFNAAVYLCS